MANQGRIAYEFETFRLDVDDRRLWQRDVVVPLTPKLFDTLRLLVEERGRLVLKEAFMRAIWSEASVTDASLAHNISALRKLLGHTDDHPVIETVAKKGYRFLIRRRECAVRSRWSAGSSRDKRRAGASRRVRANAEPP